MEPSLSKILMERREELRHDCAPVFFRLSNQEDRKRMDTFLKEHPECSVVDNLQLQLRDLVKLENPTRTLNDVEYAELIARKLEAVPEAEYGVWIYFSWKNTLVHWLDEEDFIAVRTVRNKYKITQEEQDLLRTKKVGVIGLSVGHAAAMSLAMERIGGEIRIADFDKLELSNMNRIRTSGLNLDLPKTVIVAREIAEIDPFIKVICYSEGITEENIDAFLTEGGKLDALVEECDGIDIKFLARERCRHFRIPVVMETSDRGMLDIERYDLDGEYPLFHGRTPDYDGWKLLNADEKRSVLFNELLDFQNLSSRGRASMLEVGKSITNWPQLFSSVSAGGAVIGVAVREIFLNKLNSSGRAYIDLEAVIYADREWSTVIQNMKSE